MEFGAVTPEVVRRLADVVGPEHILTQRDRMVDFSHDEYAQDDIHAYPDVVVKPDSAEQVSAVVRLAAQARIPVTARGGGTGLCGGCVPAHGGIVVALERMNRMVEVDTDNLMAVAEAGVPLSAFYAAVEAQGLFFPPHPGDESAQVGGVIATNAGGARAVKYGVIRNFVRGLQVVLADGEIVELGGKIMKSSSGYSLLNLMIGSEGTLGLITRATISLLPPPRVMYTLVAPFETLEAAIEAVPAIIQARILPMAVEFMEIDTIRTTEALLEKTWPCRGGRAHLLLIIEGSSEEDALASAGTIAELCEQRGALDVLVAAERARQQIILDIRSHIYESMRTHMLEILDVTVPRAAIAAYVNAVHGVEREFGAWLPTYGHAADGNVHTHIMRAVFADGEWKDIAGWREKYQPVRKRLHELGLGLGGAVSGEHGIGLVKKEYLVPFLGSRQVALMKQIKAAFDPRGIMNPGKVF